MQGKGKNTRNYNVKRKKKLRANPRNASIKNRRLPFFIKENTIEIDSLSSAQWVMEYIYEKPITNSEPLPDF